MATQTVTVVESESPTETVRLEGAVDLSCLAVGIPVLPEHPGRRDSVPHAPARPVQLSEQEFALALNNALRYFPADQHAVLAPEFAEELRTDGHIYMNRFRPTYTIQAYPIESYPAQCRQAACIQLMIMNNLDDRVAQFPDELVTYGGNGSVFSNWAQYHLTMMYLSEMTNEQTLTMYSGHPQGLFPSQPDAPRVVVTNGMMIPNYSTREIYEKLFALGVTQYGQMTAGSYCYIGPQGIVHGTTITILNAGRKYLGKEDMTGVVYVTAGLGGMSGAQPKAGTICGAIAVIAEVDEAALRKRHAQGWLQVVATDVEECLQAIRDAKLAGSSVSIGYLGNVVTLWEALADAADGGEMLVDLGSDQTSLHNPFNGGYYPVQVPFEEARRIMVEEPERFKCLVEETLRRHVTAVNRLADKGMRFWDYGNAFLLEASRAGADILKENEAEGYKYPTYVQDIMGDIFSLGFGPYRWVCTSGKSSDLQETDKIAAEVIREVMVDAPPRVAAQLRDNLLWIEKANENDMVVGSQARILYADCEARTKIAVAMNHAVSSGRVTGPVVISRDHHDVSGTDSPYRETSNVYDGSQWTGDMAVQNCIGDSFRGATWVSIHNGGGVGWGEVTNGGFGMVLDGSEDATRRAQLMLGWDVNNGVCRRAWARNDNAEFAIRREMERNPQLKVTLPNHTDAELLKSLASGGR